VDIAGFLGRYPPFSDLPPDRLQEIARTVEIEHVAAGETILRQGGDPATHLYVIRKGAVELIDDGRLLDLLSEGEVFGQFSLFGHERPALTVRAHEDTLCYLIPEASADQVLDTTTGRSFVIGSMRRRILSAAESISGEPPDARYTPVESLVRRPLVSASRDTSVADAARIMADQRISSLLVRMDGDWGIVTDRDLRTRMVATRGDLDAPVSSIATSPAIMLPAHTLAGEALLAMFTNGVHHFPVVDAGGAVIGVVTDTDLMGIGRHTPFALKSAIERARGPAEVVAAGRLLPDVVVALVASSADPVDVGRVVAIAIDAMTMQLLRLGIDRLGDPPVPWAWLALGSAARREQALATDQDHGLVHAGSDADVDGYFAELAVYVTDALADAGIPRCEGDAMAVHPTMRGSLETWDRRLNEWMADHSPTGSQLLSIVLDARRVSGPLDAEPVLDETVRTSRSRPAFVAHLGRRALDLRPPTGFFRNLVVEHEGEHKGTLDLKHGGILIIGSLARVHALRAGATPRDTLARLDAAAEGGALEPDDARELAEAFRFLWDVRLRHQAEQVRAGEPPDDFVDPGTLGPVARQGLKESFRVIERAQRHLAVELGVQLRR
jgi:CBS domain-containing protein